MRKKIIITLTMLLLLASCGDKNNVEEQTQEIKPKYVETEIVEEKNFSEEIKLPGKVAASKETSISSLASGIIQTINVNVGDFVKAGQILATVDTRSNLTNVNMSNAVTSYNNAISVYNSSKSSLEKSLETAKLQFDNAKIARDNTYINTKKQLELAEAQLKNASTNKGNTSTSSTTNLELSQKSLDTAKLNLDNFLKNYTETMKTLETNKASIISNLKVAIEGGFVSMDSSLNEIDKIIGATDLNKSYNDAYEIYLGAKNSSIMPVAKDLFLKNNNKYKQIKSNYNSNFPEEKLVAYYKELLDVVDSNLVLLDKMTLLLDNSVTSDTLSDASLGGMKSKMISYQGEFVKLKTNLTNLYNSYNDVVNSINSTKTNLSTQKAALEQNIKIAEATYNNTKANINTSLDSVSSAEDTTRIQYETTQASVKAARETADNNLKISEAQYTAAKANYDSQLASLKAQVDNASGQKNTLGQQLENSYIKAPYDGVIISKSIEIGSIVGQGGIAFTIANSVQKVVKLDVNSENIKYLELGKKVELSKNNTKAEGTITLVGAGTNGTGMYPIEVSFTDENFDKQVVLGDFVDVYINKDLGGEKYLVVPFSSLVVNSNGIYRVFIVNSENTVEERVVEIGASNSREVIISSGLKQGDKVIISGALNVGVGDKVIDKNNLIDNTNTEINNINNSEEINNTIKELNDSTINPN